MEFSKPSLEGRCWDYVRDSLEAGHISGDGRYSARCHNLLANQLGSPALLTHSGTAALEMAALLVGTKPGDEIIMPSYTFTSTANAFVLRGATPVFVDVRPDTLNLDETLLEQALSPRTIAIVPVHYAGIACEMDAICNFASTRRLYVIEDAAQAFNASYRGRQLGTIGALGCLSFHVTKNITSGEGGALIVNNHDLLERAHIIREKGTNRTAFLEKKVDKYEWLDTGSSYLPSDLLAAVLLAQMELSSIITQRRLTTWDIYHRQLEAGEAAGLFHRPFVPAEAQHNGHLYYLRFSSEEAARYVRSQLADQGIPAPSHYVPLHAAPAGVRYGRIASTMTVTESAGRCLLRLPLHADMSADQAAQIAEAVMRAAKVHG